MSISLTIYDVFTILLPGMMYLYILNEASLLFVPGQRLFEYSQLQEGWFLVAGVGAYITGQLFASFTYRWYRLLIKDGSLEVLALKKYQSRGSAIPIRFVPTDWQTLFGIIQHHTPNLAQSMEVFRASMAMMMNISFGTVLFAVLQGALIIQQRTLHPHLVLLICAVAATVMAIRRARDFERWFYRDIFREALNYGTSLEEVLAVSRKLTAEADQPKGRKANGSGHAEANATREMEDRHK